MRITGLLLFLLLTGCSALTPREAPDVALHEVHAFGATQLAFDADSMRLASGGFRGEVMVWHLPELRPLARLPGTGQAIRGLIWDGDAHLVTATAQGLIRRWDVRHRQVQQSVQVAPLLGIARLADERLLVVHGQGALSLLRPADMRELTQRVLDGGIDAFAISASGERIAVAMRDGRVQLFDADLNAVRTLTAAPRSLHSLRFAPDGRRLVGGAWFKWFEWDTRSGRLTTHASEHPGAIISFDFSPDGAELASLGRYTDSSVILQSSGGHVVTRRLRRHALCGWQVRYSPDGRWLASSGEDGSIYLYDRARLNREGSRGVAVVSDAGRMMPP